MFCNRDSRNYNIRDADHENRFDQMGSGCSFGGWFFFNLADLQLSLDGINNCVYQKTNYIGIRIRLLMYGFIATIWNNMSARRFLFKS